MNGFLQLVSTIQDLHHKLQNSAVNAVNQMLTIRNWLTGYYIVEFEQNGKDRAEYGKSLLKSIAENLSHIKGFDERSLRKFRQFYLFYPQLADSIRGLLTPEFYDLQIWGSLTPELEIKNANNSKTAISKNLLSISGEKILTRLSYTHIEQLLSINDALKRAFYEIEAIKGTWSVREFR